MKRYIELFFSQCLEEKIRQHFCGGSIALLINTNDSAKISEIPLWSVLCYALTPLPFQMLIKGRLLGACKQWRTFGSQGKKCRNSDTLQLVWCNWDTFGNTNQSPLALQICFKSWGQFSDAAVGVIAITPLRWTTVMSTTPPPPLVDCCILPPLVSATISVQNSHATVRSYWSWISNRSTVLSAVIHLRLLLEFRPGLQELLVS